MGNSVFGRSDDPRMQELFLQREQRIERECRKVQQRDVTQDEVLEETRQKFLEALTSDQAPDPQEWLKAIEERLEHRRLAWLKSNHSRKMREWAKGNRSQKKSDI